MDLYAIEVTTIEGRKRTLAGYRGKVLLIVNVASRCGFTPQYEGLEALYRRYRNRGLVVLGFPCDQFGNQEPGNEAEIAAFCRSRYDVTFPMFSKIEVNGPGTHLLYQYLKAAKPGLLGSEGIKWNFTKFLVGRNGAVLRRYAPKDSPEQIREDLESILSEAASR